MADRDEIERLIKLYGYVVDDREWDRLGEIVRTPKGWRFRCRHVVVTERRWVSAARA